MRMRTGHAIFIKDEQDKFRLSIKMRKLIKNAITAALLYENCNSKYEVSVIICDDEKIKEMNSEYRGVDTPTDVLSFPMEDDEILGDIVVSLEKTFDQAYKYGHTAERELIFLVVHSMLHLLGYDHEKSAEDEKIMFAKQKDIMLKYFRKYKSCSELLP